MVVNLSIPQVRLETRRPPRKAHIEVIYRSPVMRIAAEAPRAAPELIPRIYGETSGLRYMLCNATPEADKVAPTRRTRIVRGNLIFRMRSEYRVW
jgi:hypothetical protein